MTLALADCADLRPDPRPTGGMRAILIETAADWRITPEELLLPTHAHRISHPRQDFMWRCRQVKWEDGRQRYSLPKIAQFLGGMDHTTIRHGVLQHEKRAARQVAL